MKKLEFEESIQFLCAGNGLFNCKTFKFLKGVFAKNDRGYRLNAIKSAFNR